MSAANAAATNKGKQMSRLDKKELKTLTITKISERLVRDTMGELSGVCITSQSMPNKITFTLLSALTEQDLMQLLAHKLGMEDKMLALVEVKKLSDKHLKLPEGQFMRTENVIITYGVEE